jgi:polyisoprenoid-binding protein YceI
MRRLFYLSAAAVLAAAPALAQPAPGGPPPAAGPGADRPAGPGGARAGAPRLVMKVSKDPAAASAGTYRLDKKHVGVIVSVTHNGGFSYSIFRMNDVEGTLIWDPAKPEASQVTATIAANSLATNVPGFADQLTGPLYLDSAKYPAITFTSTAIKRTGPTTGVITGDLTMHGVTQPVTLDTTMIGAGQAMLGQTVGFSAKAHVSRIAFGVGQPTTRDIGDDLEITINLEFNKVK